MTAVAAELAQVPALGELATIVISPEVQDIGLREFKVLDRAVAAGHEAAVAALAEGGADALREALDA